LKLAPARRVWQLGINQAENPIEHRISAQINGTARPAPQRVFESDFFAVNEHLREIRAGFLRQLGSATAVMLLATLSPWALTDKSPLSLVRAVTTIRHLLFAVGIFWLGRLSCSMGRIKILNATWSTQHAAMDVTEKVRKEVEDNGKRDIPASNEFLGGDAHVGCLKTLSVDYTKFGLPRNKTAKENTRLLL
jgi:hypothetical protein